MTYDTNLQATQQEGTPELFHFWAGGRNERVTSWPEDLTFKGEVYTAVPLKRSGFSMDRTFKPISVRVTAPLSDIFVAYVASQPIEPTRLKLYRAISSDLSDFQVIFTGTLRRMNISQRVANAEFESKARQLRVRIPKLLYQSYCNWDVFDGDCGLIASSWEVEIGVTVSSDTLVAPVFGTYTDGYFTAGRVLYGTDERWILDHTGNTLTLQVPFDSRVQTGTIVKVLPGCDGSPDTCKNTFNNFDNYLGFPYIPSHNPVLYGFK